MDISFIINSYGRSAEDIKNSLSSCLNQPQSPLAFEVLFVDQNKMPLNVEQPNLIHLPFPEHCISKARNYGAIKAQGDWLVFVDDDAKLDENYLQILSKLLLDNPSSTSWAGAIYLLEDPQTFYSQRQNISRLELGFLEMKVFMGGNIILKRDLFAAIGKFDENFGIGGKYPSSEDTDLAWKLYYAGFAINYSPELKIFHPAPQAISMKKAYRYGLGKGALVSKWLFKQHKILTMMELAEMFLVPFGKMLIDWKNIPTHIATLFGRFKGLIRYAF